MTKKKKTIRINCFISMFHMKNFTSFFGKKWASNTSLKSHSGKNAEWVEIKKEDYHIDDKQVERIAEKAVKDFRWVFDALAKYDRT